MTNEMKNISALNLFKNSLLKKTAYGKEGFMLEGMVSYTALNKTVTELLEIYIIIGGYEPMIKLDIYSKGRIIKSDKFHLDLNPKYDDMSFTFYNGQMIIEGKNSHKIGDYKIIIEEYI